MSHYKPDVIMQDFSSPRRNSPISQRTLQEANGTRVKTMEGFQGMARLHTKTVKEMVAQRAEARKNAQAADKGKKTHKV